MDAYSLVKTAHIISATILFGTGLGIAALFFTGIRSADPAIRAWCARMTVRADFIFTLPAVIIQPLTGVWLITHGGFVWNDRWLVLTYALYILAGLCWLPVVGLQLRMRDILDRPTIDEAAFRKLYRWWFALGWPAFIGLVIVFALMVAKPTW